VNPPLKTGVFSEQLVPDVAIVDPELTITMPPTVTADCGYDALIHAVEGYVTSIDHPSEMRDTFALRAANTIFEWLPTAGISKPERRYTWRHCRQAWRCREERSP
jgi:alcohol dehydrogenase class IV